MGAANANARFPNFLSDRVTKKSASELMKIVKRVWVGEMNIKQGVTSGEHRREKSLYGLGTLRSTF